MGLKILESILHSTTQKQIDTMVKITSLNQPEAKTLIASIDWTQLIPLVVDLVSMAIQGNLFTEWKRALTIITEILKMITEAEDRASVKIDWSILLPILLDTFLPILLDLIRNREQKTI